MCTHIKVEEEREEEEKEEGGRRWRLFVGVAGTVLTLKWDGEIYKHILYNLYIHIILCVCIIVCAFGNPGLIVMYISFLFILRGVYNCHRAYVKVKDQLSGSWFSPSHADLGMAFRLQVLIGGSSLCWAILWSSTFIFWDRISEVEQHQFH